MKLIKKSIYALAITTLMLSCGNSDSTDNHNDSGHDHATESHHDHANNDQHNHDAEANHDHANDVATQIAENVDAEKFKALIEKGNGMLLDVRTPGEVANGTIEGSTNIDFNSPNFKSEIEKSDKNQPMLLFCASGGRSGSAMRMMKDMGFKEVYNLNGGYMRWPYK